MRRLATLILATVLLTGCTVDGQTVDTSEMDPIPVVVVTPDTAGTPVAEPTAEPGTTPTAVGVLLPNEWFAEYYASHEQLTEPAYTQAEAVIDWDWGLDSPDDALPVDGFSVQWTGSFEFTEGIYRIDLQGTMRVELYRSGELVMVHTALSGTTSSRLAFANGFYSLYAFVYDRPGKARVKVSWTLVGSLEDATPVPASTATPELMLTPEPTASPTP